MELKTINTDDLVDLSQKKTVGKMKRDAEEALQIIEEIISEDKPENVHITEVIKSGLNTPVLEDIILEEMELKTINTDDLVDLSQKKTVG